MVQELTFERLHIVYTNVQFHRHYTQQTSISPLNNQKTIHKRGHVDHNGASYQVRWRGLQYKMPLKSQEITQCHTPHYVGNC